MKPSSDWTAKQWLDYSIRLEEDEKPKTSTKPAFHTPDEILDAPPATFLIEGFVQKDQITLLGGPPSAGKTWIALSIAKALLSGDHLFDLFPVNEPAQRVVYLSPESAVGPLSDRIKRLGLYEYVSNGRMLVSTVSLDETVSNLRDARLLQHIAGADIFLDTLVRFGDGDENSVADVRKFNETLMWLVNQGARTVTGIHHAPKGFAAAKEMTLENMLRGSGDYGASAATVWGVAQTDEEKFQVYLRKVKGRDFAERPKPFMLEGRPHINAEGKLKMLHAPGNAPEYSSIKASLNGKKGARSHGVIVEDTKVERVMELRAAKTPYRTIAAELGLSVHTVRRLEDQAKALEAL